MKSNKNVLKESVLFRRWCTLSNILTFVRIALTPIIFMQIYYQAWGFSLCLFFIAGLTDLLDGFFARILNQKTLLGTLLDPVADKFLLVSSFGALALYASPLFRIPSWFLLLMVGRELVILLGSLTILLFYKGVKLEPMWWGKATTFLQMLFLMWIFICYSLDWEPRKTYDALLGLLAVCSILSLIQYMQKAYQEFSASKSVGP